MVCFVKYGLLFGEKVKRATDFAKNKISSEARILASRICFRRDTARSGGDGVDTYSEPSIAASNKV
jgi:hypothetical protein